MCQQRKRRQAPFNRYWYYTTGSACAGHAAPAAGEQVHAPGVHRIVENKGAWSGQYSTRCQWERGLKPKVHGYWWWYPARAIYTAMPGAYRSLRPTDLPLGGIKLAHAALCAHERPGNCRIPPTDRLGLADAAPRRGVADPNGLDRSISACYGVARTQES